MFLAYDIFSIFKIHAFIILNRKVINQTINSTFLSLQLSTRWFYTSIASDFIFVLLPYRNKYGNINIIKHSEFITVRINKYSRIFLCAMNKTFAEGWWYYFLYCIKNSNRMSYNLIRIYMLQSICMGCHLFWKSCGFTYMRQFLFIINSIILNTSTLINNVPKEQWRTF